MNSIFQNGGHLFHVDVEADKSVNMKDTFDKLCKSIGEPKNYGPTPEEKIEMERVAREEKVLVQA